MNGTWGSIALIIRAGYAAIACTIFVATLPSYFKQAAFAVRSAWRPKPCSSCGETHAHEKRTVAIFIAIETARLFLGAIGWFFYFADAALDRLEGRDDHDPDEADIED